MINNSKGDKMTTIITEGRIKELKESLYAEYKRRRSSLRIRSLQGKSTSGLFVWQRKIITRGYLSLFELFVQQVLE